MPKPTFPNTGAARRLAARVRRWGLIAQRPLLPARVRSDRPGPRNLVVVAIDTLRYDRTGLAGGAHAATPALDRLASRGTAFTDVTAPAPWTLSSFASSLTGVMPSLHGAGMTGAVRNLDREPPRRLAGGTLTLATHLASAGYRTAAFFANPFIGFGLVESFQERRYANLPARELVFLALEWIRRHGEGPFFCFVLLNDPHEPTTPPRRTLAPRLATLAAGGRDRPGRRQLSALRRWGSARAGTVELGRLEPPLTAAAERTLAIKLAMYDACVAAADEAVGDVERRLAALGLGGSTVLASFADHGEEFLDHLQAGRLWGHDPRGLYGIGHGQSLFQELIHVPWVAAGPGVPAGARVDAPVSLCDVAPTLCDWIGAPPLPLPVAAVEGLVGRSAASAPPSSADRVVLSEDVAYGPDLVAIRRGDWKLIATRGGRALALHDVRSDPGETEDRLDDRPEIAAELSGVAAQWAATRAGGPSGPAGAAPGTGSGSWDDIAERVRRQLKELGYSE
jgi:choline-sulfatase